jgi:hypothetical protein
MSGTELWTLDFEDLRRLYDSTTEQLHQALLDGVPWEDTSELRESLAALHAVLYKKMNPDHFRNPAEFQNRQE